MNSQAVTTQYSVPAVKGLDAGQYRSIPADNISSVAGTSKNNDNVKPVNKHESAETLPQFPEPTLLQFIPDFQHKRVIIRISDSRTGEVLLEVPPEKVTRAMDQLLSTVENSSIDVKA